MYVCHSKLEGIWQLWVDATEFLNFTPTDGVGGGLSDRFTRHRDRPKQWKVTHARVRYEGQQLRSGASCQRVCFGFAHDRKVDLAVSAFAGWNKRASPKTHRPPTIENH